MLPHVPCRSVKASLVHERTRSQRSIVLTRTGNSVFPDSRLPEYTGEDVTHLFTELPSRDLFLPLLHILCTVWLGRRLGGVPSLCSAFKNANMIPHGRPFNANPRCGSRWHDDGLRQLVRCVCGYCLMHSSYSTIVKRLWMALSWLVTNFPILPTTP